MRQFLLTALTYSLSLALSPLALLSGLLESPPAPYQPNKDDAAPYWR